MNSEDTDYILAAFDCATYFLLVIVIALVCCKLFFDVDVVDLIWSATQWIYA